LGSFPMVCCWRVRPRLFRMRKCHGLREGGPGLASMAQRERLLAALALGARASRGRLAPLRGARLEPDGFLLEGSNPSLARAEMTRPPHRRPWRRVNGGEGGIRTLEGR